MINGKEFCSNCMEDITSEPVTSEEGDVSNEVPVIIFFCSEDCKQEYFTEKTNGND